MDMNKDMTIDMNVDLAPGLEESVPEKPPGKKEPPLTGFQKKVFEIVLEITEQESGFTLAELKSRKRTNELVLSRFVAIAVMLEKTGMTLKSVGSQFGRDHSSIIHAREEVNKWTDSPNMYISEVLHLQKIGLMTEERIRQYLESVGFGVGTGNGNGSGNVNGNGNV